MLIELAVRNNASLLIEGDLTLLDSSSTTLDGGNPVRVDGDAVLNGILVLELTERPSRPLQVLQAGSITGDFTQITANIAGLRSCDQAIAMRAPTEDPGSYGVLVTIDERGCMNGLSSAAIAGIVLLPFSSPFQSASGGAG